MEIRCAGSDDTKRGCTVDIVENLNFCETQAPLSFKDWWPPTARLVVAGLFGNNAQRKNAIRALSPLADHFVPDPSYAGKDAIGASMSPYDTLLIVEEQEMKTVRDIWVRRIRYVMEKGEAIMSEMHLAKKNLDTRKRTILLSYREPHTQKIVEEEYAKSMHKLAQQFDTQIKLIRSEALLIEDVPMPDVTRPMQRVREIEHSALPPTELQDMKRHYATRKSYIESQVASDLGEHCQTSWLKALT